MLYLDEKIKYSGNNWSSSLYELNVKSDIYSIGVLLWEISSGQLPFRDEPYDIGLIMEIIQGFRETPVLDTPVDYLKLYRGIYQ